ncbi:hypothetical protein CUMW_160920 [Citrus unshiu]|uniref:Bidirectional sugar transporter SWEET n=1 Tax=Citrus unshiu TaxID=55188 RepID=A0A2H5PRJ2_CITUN|nr:hypothetical protein CUMW_160920 [Citrus unshiu]
MILTITYQALTVLKDAVGIAGNIFAFGLFVSPVPTFRRIIRNHSTEEFSGLPYVYALLNCLITMWYGTPLVSADNILVTTVNSIGAAFQLVYIILFITYTEKDKKVPNGIGTILGIVQLALYFNYKETSGEESRDPLIVSYA